MKSLVLHSLHRPYHCPLWIIKWICCFYARREKCKIGYFFYADDIIDLYFTIIYWLKKSYPNDTIGIPSKEAIYSVCDFFDMYTKKDCPIKLKEILQKLKREKGIETQVYSTYKAVSYYHNLASDKLMFLDKNNHINHWTINSLLHFKFGSSITIADKKIYLQQILKYDGHFFLSQCFLYKYIKKYDIKPDEAVFDFMQKYYPIPRFNYTSRSHQNYYVVRKHWVDLLGVITPSGSPSKLLHNVINNNSDFLKLSNDINRSIDCFISNLKEKYKFQKSVNEFYSTYRILLKRNEDINGFINLYDIRSFMRMGYDRFNIFLNEFYEAERVKRDIFLINIVSTIDQRKRFYVRETPVLKIKIL